MELKNWQKLHLGAELKMCKEYLSLINYCICFLIGFSGGYIIDIFINHPNSRYLNWITVLCIALAIGLVHYKIRKLIDYMISVLEAYETYQKKRDEIENRNNFKP